jgi:hypothetical protein
MDSRKKALVAVGDPGAGKTPNLHWKEDMKAGNLGKITVYSEWMVRDACQEGVYW